MRRRRGATTVQWERRWRRRRGGFGQVVTRQFPPLALAQLIQMRRVAAVCIAAAAATANAASATFIDNGTTTGAIVNVLITHVGAVRKVANRV